jgi:hypothetical protein
MFSWLITQILGNLPTWLWPALAGAAGAVYFLAHLISNFPNLKAYAFFIKPVSFAVIIFSVFMYGGAGVTAILQAQLKEQEGKIAVLQQASKDTNKAVKTKIIHDTKVIHDTRVVIQKEIQHDASKMDADCKLDPLAIKDLNDAAKNPLGTSK